MVDFLGEIEVNVFESKVWLRSFWVSSLQSKGSFAEFLCEFNEFLISESLSNAKQPSFL